MRQAQTLLVLTIGLAFPTMAAAGTPTIVSWHSRHIHTGGIPHDLGLDATKTNADTGLNGPTCEPRLGGHLFILIRFSEPVKAADGTLDRKDVMIDGWNASGTHARYADTLEFQENGTVLVLYFANGLNERSRYNISLAGKFATVGDNTPLGGDTDCQIRILFGDVTGDGQVNVGDLLAIRGAIQQPFQPRYDVNCSSTVDMGDALRAKGQLGNTCP